MEGQGTPAQSTGTDSVAEVAAQKVTDQKFAGTTEGTQNPSEMTKEQAKEAIRKLKIKHADGNEEEVDEDEVLKVYRERKGHQKAANKELQEGKAAKKEAEAFIQMLKDKGQVIELMKKVGHDPRKLAEEYLAQVLEEDLLDPREKELRQTKARLKEYEELTKKQEEEAKKKFDDEMKKKFSERYSAQFIEALKDVGVPQTKGTVAEMAKYIARAAKLKFEMTAKEAAQLVKEDIEERHKRLYGESDAETLVRLLGDQGLQKIRAYETAKLKDPNAHLRTPEQQGEPNPRVRSAGKPMDRSEWRKFNRS